MEWSNIVVGFERTITVMLMVALVGIYVGTRQSNQATSGGIETYERRESVDKGYKADTSKESHHSSELRRTRTA